MYQTINQDTFTQRVQSNVQVIDVRGPERYAQGHIHGAVNIPLEDLDQHIDKLDKEQEYHIVCQVGVKSALASQHLASKGYKIVNVEGGMTQWQGEIEC